MGFDRFHKSIEVAGGITFASISAGVTHTCGTTLGGDAYCWGSNVLGQLGDGNAYSSVPVTTPVRVAGGLSLSSVSVGRHHACGITTAGIAYCWGDNASGTLGTGYPSAPSLTPVRVALQ